MPVTEAIAFLLFCSSESLPMSAQTTPATMLTVPETRKPVMKMSVPKVYICTGSATASNPEETVPSSRAKAEMGLLLEYIQSDIAPKQRTPIMAPKS
eukprot:CAMPEP_0202960222 /NCGR_PEP_ID=MMETSP1396-20130829/4364_1 /ASSEMBLY_ACC=CAM_ASM_000872 /TAXON_ID= /ORGANISM="Pseudokeronopsis sp., Strain Brazil" /LENGTH=96 /DNA_ID=CAMNT_0049679287 /DNA_START=179 /DNA_END=469 /DNA_ORIENTATION=+